MPVLDTRKTMRSGHGSPAPSARITRMGGARFVFAARDVILTTG
jgi:hypothetical protein